MRWTIGVCVLVVGACGESGLAGGGSTTVAARDSAGIRIVEFPEAAMAELPHLTLAPEPDLEIGVREGDPDYQFAEIHGVTSLPDGGIAVIDWSPMSIRYFSPDGTFVRSVGNRGEGPGDFRMPVAVEPIEGDSLLVWDELVYRITVLGPDGSLGRTTPVARQGGLRFLGAVAGSPMYSRSGVPSEDGRRVHAIVRLPSDGGPPDTLLTHEIQEVVIPPGTIENYGPSGSPVWDPFPSFSGAPGGFLMSPGGPFEVRRIDGAGAVTEIFRYAVQRVPVTEELEDWGIDSLLAMDASPERSKIFYDIVGVADSLPSIARLYSGVGDGIWAERYPDPPYPFPPPEREFFAAAQDGTPVAWVTIPPGFSPLEFGPDWVLGVGRDEFDVRYVRRYSFVAVNPE